MRFHARHLYRFVLVGGTLVALSCASGGAWAQQKGNNDQQSAQAQAQDQGELQGQGFHSDDWAALDQLLDAHPDIAEALQANPDLIYDAGFLGQHSDLKDFCDAHPGIQQDINGNQVQFRDWFRIRRELRIMDQFLSTHPEVEQQLEANPQLVDNQKFLQDHPELRDFLNSHPEVKQAFDRNPVVFMRLETHFQIFLRDRFALQAVAQFFDSHPEVEKQLAANPKLIDERSYLADHPELQDFLKNHPEIQQVFDSNPTQFMSMEIRFQGGPGVVAMDEFLETHPDVAKQLEANPSLVNNPRYLNDHPELRNFLNSHPQVREAFTQNPWIFFHGRGRFQANGQPDVATMDAYLDKHHDEARDLDAYPARINDSDYLAHHKDLEAFLKKHPDVRTQFTQNPSAFMRQESQFDACAQMDDFLDAHKNIGKDLDQNPGSVKDSSYLDHHKDLKSFLAKNPGVSDQIMDNPGAFIGNEKRFEANRQMDAYLTNHKGVAKDLQKNPNNVKDTAYLDHHKDLKELMDKNPDLAQEAENNPSAFMQEQTKFHEEYKSEQIQQKTKVEDRASLHSSP